MDKDLHLKVCLRALATNGQWPLKIKSFKPLQYLHSIYCKLVTYYFMLFVISEYIDVLSRIEDSFLDIVNNLSVSLLYTATLYKAYIIRGSAMSKIVQQIRTIEQIILTGDDDTVKQIYMQHVRWNTKLSVRFIIIVFFTLMPFFINPAWLYYSGNEAINVTSLIEVDKPLPFKSWFPFDKNYYYAWSFLFQIIAGCIGGFLTGNTDIFYWALLIFAIGQLKILQYKLRMISQHAVGFVERKQMNMDEAIAHCVKKCIVLHQMIIRYVQDIDHTLKLLMLMDFGICSMLIGVIGFQVIVSGFGFAQLTTLEYLMAILSQVFLFYWHANEIIVESIDVAGAAWESNFYDFPQSVQKSLQFLTMRAHEPLYLNVGPFYHMSTTTAITIMRSGYSYIALMHQVYND